MLSVPVEQGITAINNPPGAETIPSLAIVNVPLPDPPIKVPNTPVTLNIEPGPVTVTFPIEPGLVAMIATGAETIPPLAMVSVPVLIAPILISDAGPGPIF